MKRIGVFNLPVDFRIGGICIKKNEIQEFLYGDKAIKIDASYVEKIDVSGLQLLVSIMKTARMRQRNVCLVALSQPLSDALARAGMQSPSSEQLSTQG